MRIPVSSPQQLWCPFSRITAEDAEGYAVTSYNRGPQVSFFPTGTGCLGRLCAAFEPDEHGTIEVRDIREYTYDKRPISERGTFRWPDIPRNRRLLEDKGHYELVAEHPPTGVCGLVAKGRDD